VGVKDYDNFCWYDEKEAALFQIERSRFVSNSYIGEGRYHGVPYYSNNK
jgi:hypothetical protein